MAKDPTTVETKRKEIEKANEELDQEFIKEYNELCKKFGRTINAVLQVQRTKNE